jgi:hypothetical protein
MGHTPGAIPGHSLHVKGAAERVRRRPWKVDAPRIRSPHCQFMKIRGHVPPLLETPITGVPPQLDATAWTPRHSFRLRRGSNWTPSPTLPERHGPDWSPASSIADLRAAAWTPVRLPAVPPGPAWAPSDRFPDRHERSWTSSHHGGIRSGPAWSSIRLFPAPLVLPWDPFRRFPPNSGHFATVGTCLTEIRATCTIVVGSLISSG